MSWDNIKLFLGSMLQYSPQQLALSGVAVLIIGAYFGHKSSRGDSAGGLITDVLGAVFALVAVVCFLVAGFAYISKPSQSIGNISLNCRVTLIKFDVNGEIKRKIEANIRNLVFEIEKPSPRTGKVWLRMSITQTDQDGERGWIEKEIYNEKLSSCKR